MSSAPRAARHAAWSPRGCRGRRQIAVFAMRINRKETTRSCCCREGRFRARQSAWADRAGRSCGTCARSQLVEVEAGIQEPAEGDLNCARQRPSLDRAVWQPHISVASLAYGRCISRRAPGSSRRSWPDCQGRARSSPPSRMRTRVSPPSMAEASSAADTGSNADQKLLVSPRPQSARANRRHGITPPESSPGTPASSCSRRPGR